MYYVCIQACEREKDIIFFSWFPCENISVFEIWLCISYLEWFLIMIRANWNENLRYCGSTTDRPIGRWDEITKRDVILESWPVNHWILNNFLMNFNVFFWICIRLSPQILFGVASAPVMTMFVKTYIYCCMVGR